MFSPMQLFTIWSFKRELTYVCLAFGIVLLSPVIAVIILTSAGLNVVSDKLASVNSVTKAIQIFNPANGSVVTVIRGAMKWPIQGRVTLEFGESDLPYQPFHTGIDIANKMDTPITPFMDGTVVYAGEIFWGYGKHVIIDNGNHIQSIYAHLDKIYVYPGEKVQISDAIGAEGKTGWATGPHLHFQINVNGIPVNPRTFLGSGN